MHYAANTLENHWMPFTTNRDFKTDPRLMVKAQGLYYWNHKGEKLIDASSGLFCCAAGHGRKEIVDAVTAQMQELDYTPHFQTGHPSSFELARMVAKITPGDLNYVFFCNSGSEAVESAIKIAIQYHRRRGEGQRLRIVGREKGYHGVNFAGWSVGGMVRNRDMFGLGMPGVSHLRHTHIPENRFTLGQGEHGADLADDLQRMVDLHGGDTIAACIVEPVAGSVGILPPPKGYLEKLRAICDKHGILLIFDEVITGFGRTGEAFAAQAFGVTPDIMTMAKAITNGNVPMAAVAVRNGIYDAIVNAAQGGIEFFHGYTWSAHPVACAAASATMKLFRDEDMFARAKQLAPKFLERLGALRKHAVVSDIRGYGLLGGIDLAPSEAPGARGFAALTGLFATGAVVRVTMDTIILAPPFIAEERDLDELFGKIDTILARM